MSRDITKAVPLLKKFWLKLKVAYEQDNPGTELFLTEVDRSPVEQLRCFCYGRLPEFKGQIITWKDGFVNYSHHNLIPSKAFDVGVKINGLAVWDDKYFTILGKYIAVLGYAGRIRWGGTFGDYPHFEIL